MEKIHTNEQKRLNDSRKTSIPWKYWGPYLSERQWGTVREDYSETGDAWSYFPHEHARSRAYHWGEDGLAGISDEKQRICLALSFWNGKDPILKERLFGLTNAEGNHGEDVKEYYFYLDNTPTHSYMKYLYKYPQSAFPYKELVQINQSRSRDEFEYELLDTGVFDDNRYFDIFIEYAKASAEDILVQITAFNRGPKPAVLHIIPTFWFRNTWAWDGKTGKPSLWQIQTELGIKVIEAEHFELGRRFLYCLGDPQLLFTENETNTESLFGIPNSSRYVKDGINDYVVNGHSESVNPALAGTKAGIHYRLEIDNALPATIKLRFSKHELIKQEDIFGSYFKQIFEERQKETDEFYQSITPASTSKEEAKIMRQALSGMLWTKQYYGFSLDKWLEEHGARWSLKKRRTVRNSEWFHMENNDVISMPDKWEYPWYAAWDLAFHTVAFSMIDLDFAEQQLNLMLRELYLHPNGQIPAYEWNFSDVNPPVHAWATMFIYNRQKGIQGEGNIDFLKHAFNKLMANFTWWVNRKDRLGQNVFEGGFLGMDNVGVFDRSSPLPTGGFLEQADGTAWMAMFCQNMLEMAVELASYDPVYDDLAPKFADHFLLIASALNRFGGEEAGLWDEADGFYYDVLRLPDGKAIPLKVRSMVGLLPLCATSIVEPYQREHVPHLLEHVNRRMLTFRNLQVIHPTGPGHRGVDDRGIIALVNPDRLKRILSYLLDENEFLSPNGIRSLSRYHADHPYVFYVHDKRYEVRYLPAESDSGMFGGNSNWRGPIWFPMNGLIIRALLQFYLYYGDNLKVPFPTGSQNMMNLYEVAKEITNRLTKIFLPDEKGYRPVFGGSKKFQEDIYWKDNILFYEYFHGENGAGLGASHQTGWTGLIAPLIHLFHQTNAQSFLEIGKIYSPKTYREKTLVGQ